MDQTGLLGGAEEQAKHGISQHMKAEKLRN